MLSLEECRRVLGPRCSLSDAGLESLRDQIRDLAVVVINSFVEGPQTGDHAHDDALRPAAVSENDRDAVAERAAMLEFDGGMTREEAERAAVSQYHEGSDLCGNQESN